MERQGDTSSAEVDRIESRDEIWADSSRWWEPASRAGACEIGDPAADSRSAGVVRVASETRDRPFAPIVLTRVREPRGAEPARGMERRARDSARGNFGRWWLGGCLVLGAFFAAGGSFWPSPPEKAVAARSAHKPASKSIEAICVGQRVLTQDANGSGGPTGTAVDPKTWKKVALRADMRWDDGTHDDVNVETLQPREWIRQHNVHVGAIVPLPLDLVEMGLPAALHAVVVAVEPCPEIPAGPGRVVLTTVNHLNRLVFELAISDTAGHTETLHTTGFHKFYSATRNSWISANELRNGEKLRGVNGMLTVTGLRAFPGMHRVYNMTVEDEHVYRVSMLGALVHNEGCGPGSVVGEKPGTAPVGTRGRPIPSTEGNPPTTINGRPYSGHAVDRIQGRGLTPSVVENTIKPANRIGVGNTPGTSVFFDPVNNVTVVVDDATGRVITTW